jgi:hypothetical protein
MILEFHDPSGVIAATQPHAPRLPTPAGARARQGERGRRRRHRQRRLRVLRHCMRPGGR